jgi:alpha-amylase/alpha-mannosidase (GH57 family)
MTTARPVELLLIWHQHQPDYRDPRTGAARLPWVRLHVAKDYVDMARRLARFPDVRVTFNLVPSLVDQIEAAARGAPDELFDLLARDPETLSAEERTFAAARCLQVPPHALSRWPAMRLCHEASRRAGRLEPGALLALEVWFLLAWLDPFFHAEPEARAAIEADGSFTHAHREALLTLHAKLLGDVVPAHRELADRGQVELSASPYYHPILPLVVDVRSLGRARPDLPVPREPFAAPEDARRQVAMALDRHAEVFGRRPLGMWPSEGSVSPEVAAIAAQEGVRWLATDEAVLRRSLGGAWRPGAHYGPWRLETPAGDVTLFFRDHELSDRIGFVYQRWDAKAAVEDFLARLRRIGSEHSGGSPAVVSVILDGENCWEGYADDGGPFLDQLYAALGSAPDIRTTTPAAVLAGGGSWPRLPDLHTGSWIDADFHIWAGHPEKNRAWELLSRARATLAARPDADPAGWESLMRAEGSDWFWWFGDDHYTADKLVFDALFREHLGAIYRICGEPAPLALGIPITSLRAAPGTSEPPVAYASPRIDGRRTHFYEWQPAGRRRLAGQGGSMHAVTRRVTDVYYGFDRERLYLRVDFTSSPGGEQALRVEVLEPRPVRLEIGDLSPGEKRVERAGADSARAVVPGAACAIEDILELAVPLAELGIGEGDPVELLVQVLEAGQPVETSPPDDAIRFLAPDGSFDAAVWQL